MRPTDTNPGLAGSVGRSEWLSGRFACRLAEHRSVGGPELVVECRSVDEPGGFAKPVLIEERSCTCTPIDHGRASYDLGFLSTKAS